MMGLKYKYEVQKSCSGHVLLVEKDICHPNDLFQHISFYGRLDGKVRFLNLIIVTNCVNTNYIIVK